MLALIQISFKRDFFFLSLTATERLSKLLFQILSLIYRNILLEYSKGSFIPIWSHAVGED